GERDADGAARAAVQALLLGGGVALVLGVLGARFAPRVLEVMGASPSVVAGGGSYARIMLGGNATVLLLFLINAIFRGAGDAAIAMRVLWLANAINIALGPCLIFGLGPFPRLGVAGAALATNIGRGTGVLYALSRLLRPGSRIDIRARHIRLDRPVLRRLTRLSATGALQTLVGTASWIALVRILAAFGGAVVAGYTIGMRVIMFALLPSWGLANAAATMVGQALGARKPDRAERAVWIAGTYNLAFLGSIGLAFVLGAGPIVGIFTSDPGVRPFAVDCLRVIALGFVFYAYGMVLAGSFNGAGDTTTPTVLNVLVFWIGEIPLAYALAHVLKLGPHGVFVAIALSFSLLALLSAIIFRRGRWKLREL
ncbi:MAG TPA: MATE family efflux transporter, partial [Gemmatimonadaceae bacterium]|nr:MATE family efflux transporter [Gemmatimonadaceae bacterium]